MRDRIVGELETGCRLGEMLKIQNRHVIWNTHQISIPAEHAKDAGTCERFNFSSVTRISRRLSRYLNVTDEELRKTMQQKLWSRTS